MLSNVLWFSGVINSLSERKNNLKSKQLSWFRSYQSVLVSDVGVAKPGICRGVGTLRPEGPKFEAELPRAWGVLGDGAASSPAGSGRSPDRECILDALRAEKTRRPIVPVAHRCPFVPISWLSVICQSVRLSVCLYAGILTIFFFWGGGVRFISNCGCGRHGNENDNTSLGL